MGGKQSVSRPLSANGGKAEAGSPSTIDRKLRADKRKLAVKGKSCTKPGSLLKKQIPIRTYYADADKNRASSFRGKLGVNTAVCRIFGGVNV